MLTESNKWLTMFFRFGTLLVRRGWCYLQTKDKVLVLLSENPNQTVSGQWLANELSMSRTAIWKAIQTLQNEGYEIESVPNAGYRLAKDIDFLHAELIRKKLHHQLDIRVLDSIDSTNEEAKRILNSETKPEVDTVILANEQTKGKGRLGRYFHSPEQTGLYMSVAMPKISSEADPTLLTTVAAVAACFAIEKLTDLKPQIKWVNDIFLDGKKICGILTEGIINLETQKIESIILGIGVNLTREEEGIPNEFKHVIGSLFEKDEQQIKRNELSAAILNEFYTLYENMSDKKYLDEYRKRCFVLGQQVSFTRNKQDYTGTAEQIDDTGALIVRLSNGETITLSYGEISIKIEGSQTK